MATVFIAAIDTENAGTPRPDHAAYIDSWLRVLRNDKRSIFTAGAKAQAAVDYLTERAATARVAA